MPRAREEVWVSFIVNGAARHVVVAARRTLADVLREDLGLTGTHLGCEHGVCGSCTVLVDGLPVRSCLGFAAQFDGADVRTIEGGDMDEDIRLARQLVVEERGLQCGFCTPGFVMALAGLHKMGWHGDGDDLAVALSSNLCRCTGYTGLLRAAARLLGDQPGHVDQPPHGVGPT